MSAGGIALSLGLAAVGAPPESAGLAGSGWLGARVAGPVDLHGREVQIADLRAGATLILAALAANETSIISGVEHVDRGYEQVESKLVALGAQIHRIDA